MKKTPTDNGRFSIFKMVEMLCILSALTRTEIYIPLFSSDLDILHTLELLFKGAIPYAVGRDSVFIEGASYSC